MPSATKSAPKTKPTPPPARAVRISSAMPSTTKTAESTTIDGAVGLHAAARSRGRDEHAAGACLRM